MYAKWFTIRDPLDPLDPCRVFDKVPEGTEQVFYIYGKFERLPMATTGPFDQSLKLPASVKSVRIEAHYSHLTAALLHIKYPPLEDLSFYYTFSEPFKPNHVFTYPEGTTRVVFAKTESLVHTENDPLFVFPDSVKHLRIAIKHLPRNFSFPSKLTRLELGSLVVPEDTFFGKFDSLPKTVTEIKVANRDQFSALPDSWKSLVRNIPLA